MTNRSGVNVVAVMGSSVSRNGGGGGSGGGGGPPQQVRHIDKGKIADDIYRGMLQSLYPTINQFIQSGQHMEMTLTQVQQSSKYFYEVIGRAGECAMGSAVSSDLADVLVDISDTYITLIEEMATTMPNLRNSLLGVMKNQLQTSARNTPQALKDHHIQIKSKSERLNKAVKELHKYNQKTQNLTHRNPKLELKLSESLEQFKISEKDLREYKENAYQAAALEERKLLASFVEINGKVTSAYIAFLNRQIDALQNKSDEWNSISEELNRKLSIPEEESASELAGRNRGEERSGGDASSRSGSESSGSHSGSSVDDDEEEDVRSRSSFGNTKRICASDVTHRTVPSKRTTSGNRRGLVAPEPQPEVSEPEDTMHGSLPRIKVFMRKPKKESNQKKTDGRRRPASELHVKGFTSVPLPTMPENRVSSPIRASKGGSVKHSTQKLGVTAARSPRTSFNSKHRSSVGKHGHASRASFNKSKREKGGSTGRRSFKDNQPGTSSSNTGHNANDEEKKSHNLLKAIYQHAASGNDGIQLEFKDGDTIKILNKTPPNNGWQYGLNQRTNKQGWFPISFTIPTMAAAQGPHSRTNAEHDYERISESGSGDSIMQRPDYPPPDYIENTQRQDGRDVTIQERRGSSVPYDDSDIEDNQFTRAKLRPASTNDRSKPIIQ